MDVFISYSRKDRAVKDAAGVDVILRIQQAFQDAGISYWLDEEGIHSGETFASVISRNIADAKVFLFVSSANSNASRWTCGEIATASSYDKRIIPFRIDAAPYDPSVTIYLAALDTIDYTANPEKAIRRLVTSVQLYLDELETEARRIEEEKRMLAEKKRLEAERERIRLENAKVIAGLTVRQTELEGKIQAIDARIDSYLNEKDQLLARLKALRSGTIELKDENTIQKTVSDKEKPMHRVALWIPVSTAIVLAVGLLLWLTLRNREPNSTQTVAVIPSSPETTADFPADTIGIASVAADTVEVEALSGVDITMGKQEERDKQDKTEVEKPKVVLAIDGHEGALSFTMPSDEAGSKIFSIKPSSRVNFEHSLSWCRIVDDTPKRKKSSFELQWDANPGETRSGEIRVKSGSEEVVITVQQVESKAVAEAREIKEAREKAESIAREQYVRDSIKKADALAVKMKTRSYDVGEGMRLNVLGYQYEDGVIHITEVIDIATWNAVMGKKVRNQDIGQPQLSYEQDLAVFLSRLKKITGLTFRKPFREEIDAAGGYPQLGGLRLVLVE